MFHNDPDRHLRFNNRTAIMQNKARNCFAVISLLAICLIVLSFTGGCFGEAQNPGFQLHLSAPVVNGKNVSLNGGISIPAERIQWSWGDGQTEKHHFFPADHTYSNPGKYQITVTAYDSNNTSASKSVDIEIK